MKEHIREEMINALTKEAEMFVGTQQLRSRLSRVVSDYIQRNEFWMRNRNYD